MVHHGLSQCKFCCGAGKAWSRTGGIQPRWESGSLSSGKRGQPRAPAGRARGIQSPAECSLSLANPTPSARTQAGKCSQHRLRKRREEQAPSKDSSFLSYFLTCSSFTWSDSSHGQPSPERGGLSHRNNHQKRAP